MLVKKHGKILTFFGFFEHSIQEKVTRKEITELPPLATFPI